MPASQPAARGGHARMHVLMFLVTFFWASNIIAGKEALTGFSALALAQLRVLGAAIIFVILFLGSGRMRRLQLSARKWLFLVAIAATGIALNQITFIGGIARTSVAHTGLIVALGPLMVLIIAVLVRLEKLTAWKAAGMLIAFAGVAILTMDKAGRGSTSHTAGDIIMLGSALVFAIYQVLMKEVANQFDALTLNTLIYVLGTMMMLPFCGHAVIVTNWAAVRPEAWWGLAFLIVFGSVISYLLFAYVLTELAASRAAAFNYFQPVMASALGFWILSERLTSNVLTGGGLILIGVYLAERERGEEKDPDPSINF
jgi:drug/metabolite transporter (DMT)-like permease